MASMAGEQSAHCDFSRILPHIITLRTHLDSVTYTQSSGWNLVPHSPVKIQACDFEETGYVYHDPSSEAILGETLIQIKEVAAQKEQLLEEIQKLSDQLTQEKAICESLESDINKAQDEVEEEVLCHQMQQLRANVSTAGTLVCNVETFQTTELFHLNQEVKYLRAAQAKFLEIISYDIACLQKIIQERQMKESRLRSELWALEDEERLSDLKTMKLKVMISSHVEKIDEQEKAYQVYLGFMQEALDHASETRTETGEVCRLLSDASQIPHHSNNSSSLDITLA